MPTNPVNSPPDSIANALYRSLVEAPALVGDLPEGKAFAAGELAMPEQPPPLNLQQKLGHLYEDAFAHLLEASPHYDLLERNLQIRKDAHTTVGELDFLLRDGCSGDLGGLLHLELAIKFYLAVDTADGLALPGPDARDNYFKKIHHLRSHQLLMPVRFKEYLPAAYRDEAIITQQLIHGCFFDHIHAVKLAQPEHAHPAARHGRWLHLDELADHFPSGTTFELIPKPLWPVPLDLLGGIRLEQWSPDPPIDRCVMLRVADQAVPYFVAPAGYADRVRG